MKDRIAIPISYVSLIISCFVTVGCTPSRGYITVDSRSELAQPTFCMYWHWDFQEPTNIRRITVWKAQSSYDTKKRWELDSPSKRKDAEKVWCMEYIYSDFYLRRFINRLLGRRDPPIVSCLTYGEVPPGYQERVQALPLEPDRLYTVSMTRTGTRIPSEVLKFIIRFDDKGIPERLEYRLWDGRYDWRQYYLKLYPHTHEYLKFY